MHVYVALERGSASMRVSKIDIIKTLQWGKEGREISLNIVLHPA